MPQIVITRHGPLVELLRERGVIDERARIIAHATEADVKGKHVIGVLPLRLAALAKSVTEVPLELTPRDREAMQRGDLSLERMREVAGAPATYVVRTSRSPAAKKRAKKAPKKKSKKTAKAGSDTRERRIMTSFARLRGS